ncbi:PR domain zinc finger protein 2 [Neosynchiropus ocellatus]
MEDSSRDRASDHGRGADLVEAKSGPFHKQPLCAGFVCTCCQTLFTSKHDLDQHIVNKGHANKSEKSKRSSGSNPGQPLQDRTQLLDSSGSVPQRHIAPPTSPNTCVVTDDGVAATEEWDVHRTRSDCEKTFTSQATGEQHESRALARHLRDAGFEASPHMTVGQEAGLGVAPAAAHAEENERRHSKQYMLDVSSSISDSLSFYIDGKVISSSTVSGCEATDVHSGSLTSVKVDVLMVDPVESSTEPCLEAPAKRRTATPPVLPEAETSASVASSREASETREVQKHRPVFPFEKLKQLLKKQDSLKQAVNVVAEGQSPSASLSAGAGRFKRRTGSPQGSPQPSPSPNEGTVEVITEDCAAESVDDLGTRPECSVGETEHTPRLVEEPVEGVPADSSSKACHQQPLDLSSTMKRGDAGDLPSSALDLSLQKKSVVESEFLSNLVLQAVLRAEGKTSSSMFEKTPLSVGEESLTPVTPEASLLPDLTLVTGPEMADSGLVYGLALPSSSLTGIPSSLSPVALQPAPPCTIAFAPPGLHSVLSTAPSLFTVLTPSPLLPSPPNQPIQVLTSNISPEPLVVCTENALSPSECDLTNAFSSSNPANLVTLAQTLDPSLNLPVILADQISPVMDTSSVSQVPFPPALALNDSLMNSYNITSNTVLIECTIALDAPADVFPPAGLQGNTAENPGTQMVVNHIEREQILSLPSAPDDAPVLLSSTAELVSSTAVAPPVCDSTPEAAEPTMTPGSPGPPPVCDPIPSEVLAADTPVRDDEGPDDPPVLTAQCSPSPSPSPSPEKYDPEESQTEAPDDPQPQTFTKNFVCNVCDQLFHSMKELGHHVGSHAEEWPFKCEFCVLLFEKPAALLDHRASLHGVGKTYVCSACAKDFVYLSNLKQHQEELHPGKTCSYTEEEKGKLRPQNYNTFTKATTDSAAAAVPEKPPKPVKKEEDQVKVAAEELLTTIKILAANEDKVPDVRLGINQHYPSFKPPPFPYHNRSPAGSTASATNFTTHNIPQTFTTAIRCTKCGKSFDNMPELHKHILACANASDKRRYTPKKNPIPLRHFAKSQNGVLATTNSSNEFNAPNRASQSGRSKHQEESTVKEKLRMLSRRKKKLAQRVLPHRNKSITPTNLELPAREVFACPRCGRDFTMRRSRTKHMAVCLKKSEEARKDGGISLTKENDRRLQVKGAPPSSPHKTRLQTSGPAKRPAVPAEPDASPHKRSKTDSDGPQPKPEPPSLNELHVTRTFHPAMRQYSRMRHGVKELPIKLSVVAPPQNNQDELTATPGGGGSGILPSSSKQSTTA